MQGGWAEFLFSFEGRIGRGAYLRFAGLALLVFFISFVATPPTLDYMWVTVGSFLALLWMSFAVGAKRLHDIGYSGWMQAAWFVPFLGPLVLFVMLVGTRGDPNANRYGPPPP